MTQAEKLEALVQRAIDGGWENGDAATVKTYSKLIRIANPVVIRGIIFNHDFARALFADWPQVMKDAVPSGVSSVTDKPAWQYHLQQVVISKDPIEYMYKTVSDTTN